MTDEILFYVIIPIGSTLVGVVIGAVATYYSSLTVLQRQQNIQKLNIAKAFLSEIKMIEKWLLPTVKDNFLVTNEDPIMFNLFKHALKDLNWDRPFYDDDGLFFISRPEIYCFDEGLFEKLELFYSNLLTSEEDRQIFIKNSDFTISRATYHDKKRYRETIDAIKHTYETISDIQTKLDNIISTYGKK
jgi:CHASE1-domain containing sensor protein